MISNIQNIKTKKIFYYKTSIFFFSWLSYEAGTPCSFSNFSFTYDYALFTYGYTLFNGQGMMQATNIQNSSKWSTNISGRKY